MYSASYKNTSNRCNDLWLVDIQGFFSIALLNFKKNEKHWKCDQAVRPALFFELVPS